MVKDTIIQRVSLQNGTKVFTNKFDKGLEENKTEHQEKKSQF